MQNVLEKLFTISLILSLLCAFTMIMLQILGLFISNGEFIINSSEWLKEPTIMLAAIFSAIAFLLGYFPKYRESEPS